MSRDKPKKEKKKPKKPKTLHDYLTENTVDIDPAMRQFVDDNFKQLIWK